MEIHTLAASAVAIITPYLARLAGKCADAIGDKVADSAARLYNEIKVKLSADDYARKTLERVKEKPESTDRGSTLSNVLAEHMRADDQFAERISSLVNLNGIVKGNTVYQTGERGIAIGGSVTQSTISAGDSSSRQTDERS